MKVVVALMVALVAIQQVHAANWAFLVSAGDADTSLTNTMEASVCRLYHILIKNGIAKEHIILMMSDYFANATENPIPGKLFDMPDGTDVYAGCVKDYVGDDVNVDIYTAVLTGNFTGVKGHGSEKVLNVTAQDSVYVYYNDHGGPGAVYFPGWVPFTADMNQAAITTLTQNAGHVYFTIMACESGSMFEFVNETYTNLVAESSSDGESNSMAAFCDGSKEGNVTLDFCLTSEFEAGLVNDYLNNKATSSQSVHSQYAHVDLWMEADQLASSEDITPPVIFGAANENKKPVSDFWGKPKTAVDTQSRHHHSVAPTTNVVTPKVWIPAPAANSVNARLHCAIADLRAALRSDLSDASSHAADVATTAAAMHTELTAHVNGRAAAESCHAPAIMSSVGMREVDLLRAYSAYLKAPTQESAQALAAEVAVQKRTTQLYGALAEQLDVELAATPAARRNTNWACVRKAIVAIRDTCDDVDMATRYLGTLVNACLAHGEASVLKVVHAQCRAL